MMNATMDYLENVSEMLQKTYKISIDSTTQFQDSFSHMLKDIVSTNSQSISTWQTLCQNEMQKNIKSSLDMTSQLAEFYRETVEKGIEMQRDLFDKYHIENGKFREEMEKLWKDHSERIEGRMKKFTESTSSNQEKQYNELKSLYTDHMKKTMEDFEKKLKEMKKEK
jgi:gas vesicle protein